MSNSASKHRWSGYLPRVAYSAVLGLVILGLIYAFVPRPVLVDLATIEHGSMQVAIEEDGMTRIKERFVVASPLEGRLQRIALDPGDTVTEGETLLAAIEPLDPALLDSRARAEAEARKASAEARFRLAEPEMLRAQAELELAETDWGRAMELEKRGSATPSEVDQARLVFRQAQQNYRSADFAQDVARFELKLAEAALIQTQDASGDVVSAPNLSIISPITGRVLRVFQESSKVVLSGESLIELGDPIDLEIVVDVLSSDAVRINRRLQDASATPPRVLLEHWGGDTPLNGVVRLVEPSGFTKISALGVEEQRVNVIVDFNESLENRGALGDGFRVEARIVVWEQDDVLIVPTSALFRHQNQWAVFKVQEDRAVLQPVTIGERNGLQAELLEGLQPADRVVVHPGDQVEHDVRVAPRE